MKNIIAIDLGSNAIRALKIDCKTEDTISSFHKTVRTADNLANTGEISSGALERILKALDEINREMDFSSSTIKAVTTEALRQASNSQEILDEIKSKTGVTFNIINGDDEAKYALIATKNRLEKLNLNIDRFVLADIGGASTELIFNYRDRFFSKSFPIGIVTITEKYNNLKDLEANISNIMINVKKFRDEIYRDYGEVDKFIAIAGTPTTLASLKLGLTYSTYDASKIHGTILTKEDLDTQLNSLLNMSKEEREETIGVGREDLIASGIVIYKELYNICNFNKSIVVDDGIREGVAFSECAKLSSR